MGVWIPRKGYGPKAGNGAGMGKAFKNGKSQGNFIQNPANAVALNVAGMLVFNGNGAVMEHLAGD